MSSKFFDIMSADDRMNPEDFTPAHIEQAFLTMLNWNMELSAQESFFALLEAYNTTGDTLVVARWCDYYRMECLIQGGR